MSEPQQKTINMKHKIIKSENCYYCTRCGLAGGDGDGLIGEKCSIWRMIIKFIFTK